MALQWKIRLAGQPRGFDIFNNNEKSTVVTGFDIHARMLNRWILLGEFAYYPKVHFFGIQNPLFFNRVVRYSGRRLTADARMLSDIETGLFSGFPVACLVYRLY